MAENKALKFYQAYQSQIMPVFDQLEEKRKQETKKIFLAGIFTILACMTLLIFIIANLIPPKYTSPEHLTTISTTVRKTTQTSQDTNDRKKHEKIMGSAIGLLFILPFLLISYSEKKKKAFKIEVKERCRYGIMQAIGNIQWESPTNNDNIRAGDWSVLIRTEEIISSGLFGQFEERSTDDEFRGTYKHVEFRVSETALYNVYRDKNGHKRRSPIFNGVILLFDNNKYIKNRAIIATKGLTTGKDYYYKTNMYNGVDKFLRSRNIKDPIKLLFVFSLIMFIIASITKVETIGIIILLIFIPIYLLLKFYIDTDYLDVEKYEKVELEDPAFNKRFNVYSSDQIEARYLITTAFMDRFYNMKTAFGAKNARCSFFNSQIMIAIDTDKDLFELGDLYTSLKDPRAINEFYKQISSIIELIEYFKLDQYTGL